MWICPPFRFPSRPPVLLVSSAASFFLSLSICVEVKYPSIREKKQLRNPMPTIKAPYLAPSLHTNIFQTTCMSATQGGIQYITIQCIIIWFKMHVSVWFTSLKGFFFIRNENKYNKLWYVGQNYVSQNIFTFCNFKLNIGICSGSC